MLNAAPSNLVKVPNTGSESKLGSHPLSPVIIAFLIHIMESSFSRGFFLRRVLSAKEEVPYPAKFGGLKMRGRGGEVDQAHLVLAAQG